MLVVLKIPVVYLCAIVWWAIRAEPGPLEGAALPATLPPGTPACDRRSTSARPQRPGPVRGGGAGTWRRATYARKAER